MKLENLNSRTFSVFFFFLFFIAIRQQNVIRLCCIWASKACICLPCCEGGTVGRWDLQQTGWQKRCSVSSRVIYIIEPSYFIFLPICNITTRLILGILWRQVEVFFLFSVTTQLSLKQAE